MCFVQILEHFELKYGVANLSNHSQAVTRYLWRQFTCAIIRKEQSHCLWYVTAQSKGRMLEKGKCSKGQGNSWRLWPRCTSRITRITLLFACPHTGVLIRTENSLKIHQIHFGNGYQWMLNGKHLSLRKVINRLSSYTGEVVYKVGVQIKIPQLS